MESYWKSDSLQFIGNRGVNYGWQTILDNYKKSYSTPEEMGTLKFENVSVQQIDVSTVFVMGKWSLERDTVLANLKGHYSLLWQRKNGEWVIIADHSS